MLQKNLQQLFDEYISERQYTTRLRMPTILSYKLAFKYFTTIMPEVTMPEDLVVPRMHEFFKRVDTRKRIVGKNTIKMGVKISTIHTYGGRLRAFFEWLVEQREIKENPLSEIKIPAPEYTDQRALKKEQVEKIYTAITLHSKNSLILRRDTAMVSTFLFCGLRSGELAGLTVPDIDMIKRTLHVRPETSKSKKPRTLPIHPILLLHLRDYMEERKKLKYKTESLFVSSNGDRGLSAHGYKHWVEKLVRDSGVKFHRHRFRHTFATNLANCNTGIVKIQKLMGHSDLKMTARYLRSVDTEFLEEDIAKLSIENLM